MDIKKGLLVIPPEKEVVNITQGRRPSARNFAATGREYPRIIIPTREMIDRVTRETGTKMDLATEITPQYTTDISKKEVNLYEYKEHRVASSPTGLVGRLQKRPPKQGPANVVFLTSIRDTGRYDLNGQDIAGIIETANTAINEEFLNLGDSIRIRGIITDDLPLTDNLGAYPCTPTRGKPWIHPLNAKNDRGEFLVDITERIPSDSRVIPKDDKDLRRQKRIEFEEKVFKTSMQMGADILVVDHLMFRLIDLINETRFGIGRILNIHPGIADTRNPNRLPGSTPTLDAISRANWGAVFNKKKGLYLPPENPSTTGRFKTGATLHIVDKRLDTGPVIADAETTFVRGEDRPQELRRRNYPVKRAVFILGIIHYVRTMLDRIDRINFDSNERTKTVTRI
jgi:folate-dependent phosphoribosylglycinamide formyltransferase PurN